MLEIEATTFEECLKIKSQDDRPPFQYLKFVRFGKEIFVDSTDLYHLAITAAIGKGREGVSDAGSLSIIHHKEIFVIVSGDSSSLNFSPSKEQRVETIRILTEKLLGLARVKQ